jgi:nucleotide-binding universal stress UspA family protein
MVVASIATRDGKGRLGLAPGGLAQGAERLAAYVSAHLHEFDLSIEGRHVKSSSPASGLAKLAEDEGADLIVVGSTHRGPIGRILPGGTAERLLGTGPCAVAVAPRGTADERGGPAGWRPLSESEDDDGLRVIGVGYDGSSQSEEALERATSLALGNGSAMRVFAVGGAALGSGIPGSASAAGAHGAPDLRDRLLDAVADLPPEARAEAVYLRGFPAAELTAVSEGGIDLLVLGSRGGGPLRQALLGSVSSKVMHGAGCPVLISPSGAADRRPVLMVG